MKFCVFLLLIFLQSIHFSKAEVACQDGFTLVSGIKCLMLISSAEQHSSAAHSCSELGATLAIIRNAIDNRVVSQYASSLRASSIWLGVFCFESDPSMCYYDNGSGTLVYNNFVPGYPIVKHGFGGCVYMLTTGTDQGKWYTGSCEQNYELYVCEALLTIEDKTCQHNYSGYCFIPSYSTFTEKAIFSEALTICRNMNAGLASIHSKLEVDFIRGMLLLSNIDFIFLGSHKNQTWLDGSIWDYEYMDPFGVTTGDCLQMNTSNNITTFGLWSRSDCGNENYFVCKKKIQGNQVLSEWQKKPEEKVLDNSNCNTTFYMIPGTVTSFGYPSTPIAYCTWRIVTLGPYNIAFYFTELSTGSSILIKGTHEELVRSIGGNQPPTRLLVPINDVTMSYNSKNDAGFHGFSVTILPY